MNLSGLDCTTNANGGALTTNASGEVLCSDDDAGGGGGNTLDQAYDQGGAGAGRMITADSGAVTIEGAGGLVLDAGNLLQTPGDPALVGSLGLGTDPLSVYVSGRYAYVVDTVSDDLKVIDVSDPGSPSLAGSLGIGSSPRSVYVSGRYAYVVDSSSGDLQVIDVSDPGTPSLAGSLNIGENPISVYVSGRYAYVVDSGFSNLKVIDVSDPGTPGLAGSLNILQNPTSVYVSGRYAYVVDSSSDDLKVIDVSDPGAPSLAGSLVIGEIPMSVYVSGRYAYVVDVDSDDLKVIDVSDPGAPSLAGSLSVGTAPWSVYVSGRYAYIVDVGSDDLKMIDVSDPATPSLVGSLSIGAAPRSVYVSGRYAYVVDGDSDDLKVIDVSGAEVTALMAHSLEAGNLQVRNDVIAQGQLQVTGGVNVGSGGLFSDGDVGVDGSIAAEGTGSYFLGDTGFGTATPTHRLHVRDDPNGAASTANHVALIENVTAGNSADILVIKMPEIGAAVGAENNYISFHDGGGGSLGAIQGNGAGSVTYAGAGNDYAEYLPRLDRSEQILPGDVIGVFAGGVSKRTAGADLVLAASTGAIVAGNDPGEENRDAYVLVAFMGQAVLQVRGPVMAGDLIVASGDDDGVGVAVSADLLDIQFASQVVGQAWESNREPQVKRVRALVGLVQPQVITRSFRQLDARLRSVEIALGLE
jgi:hypothetical protein